MADPKFSVELAIRAGQLAKSALAMAGLQDPTLAQIQFIEVVKQLRDLDVFLKASNG